MAPPAPGDRKPSTPLASDEEEAPNADLSALESALQVFLASESQLPELLDTTGSGQAANSDSAN